MAEVEEEHSVSAVIDAGIHDGRHQASLSSIFKARAVAYVRSAGERDVALEEVGSLLAEALHCPFPGAVYA